MKDHGDEADAVTKMSKGSVAAFDILYQKYHQAIYANILKIVVEPATAEDILQEVFLTLWENRHTIHLDKPVAGWLFVVSYNKSISYLKQKIKESFIIKVDTLETIYTPQDEAGIDEEDNFELQVSIIEAAVGFLPSRKKEVFRLCRYEGRSYEEVAAEMDISVQSVKDYLKQSTAFIKSYVKNNPHASNANSIAALMVIIPFL